MYKYIGVMMICMMGTVAVADAIKTCNGGTLITANTSDTYSNCISNGVNYCNGLTFCMSNRAMNWWSAEAWCQSNYRKLVSASSACPSWQGEFTAGCQNLAGRVPYNSWTGLVGNTNENYHINGNNITHMSGFRSGLKRALCE